MTRQRTTSLRSIGGSAFLAPGLFILLGNVAADAAQLNHLLSPAAGHGVGTLSSILLAATLHQQNLLSCLVQVLLSFWPLLLVLAGTALLRDAFPDRAEALPTPETCSAKKDLDRVDLGSFRSSSK
jgi:hypothetical protein